MHRSPVLFSLSLSLFAALPISHAQYAYTLSEVGADAGYVQNSYVDSSGDVAVSEATTSYSQIATVTYNGVTTTIPGVTVVDGITSSGVVLAGTGTTAILDDHGTITSLGLPSSDDHVNAISANGAYIVGSSGSQLALFGTGGSVTPISTTLGDESLTVTSVTNSGVISGYYMDYSYNTAGFIYSNGTFTTVAAPAGDGSFISGSNNLGTFVGEYSNNRYETNTGFVDTNGTVTTLTGLGGSQYTANGINDSGQIVGSSQTASGGQSEAVIYQNGQAVNLNTLVNLTGSNFTSLIDAYTISSNGYIVGSGVLTDGNQAEFELTPGGLSVVPEPMTYLLWTVLGLTGLAAWRMRQRAQAAA